MATATKTKPQALSVRFSQDQARPKSVACKTETEAIERALDFAIAEHEKNRLVLQATERFIKSGIEIKDVYGTLVG